MAGMTNIEHLKEILTPIHFMFARYRDFADSQWDAVEEYLEASLKETALKLKASELRIVFDFNEEDECEASIEGRDETLEDFHTLEPREVAAIEPLYNLCQAIAAHYGDSGKISRKYEWSAADDS